MQWSKRIVVDPGVLAGKPVIQGTRLAAEFILELLSAGQSEQEILNSYQGSPGTISLPAYPGQAILRGSIALTRSRHNEFAPSMRILADENFPK